MYVRMFVIQHQLDGYPRVAEPTIRCRNGRQIRRSSVDVTARCFKKCVLRNSSSEWLISCWKKNLNRVTGLSATLQHVCTQHVCPHLGLSWYFWSRARVLERFHFEGDEEKTFLKNGVTAQLFFCCENFLVLKCPSGSGAAQLPHEHFKNKKFSLEVSQPEDGLFEKTWVALNGMFDT